MSALMEHHDFKTARRALVVGSIALYIASDLQFLSNEIEILKLRFAVSQDKITLLGTVAVCYFAYIFSLRAYEVTPIASEFLPGRIEKLHTEASKRMSEMQGDRSLEFRRITSPFSTLDEWEDMVPENVKSEAEAITKALHSFKEEEQQATRELISNLREQVRRVEARKQWNFILAELAPPYLVAGIAIAKSLGVGSFFEGG